MRPSITQLAHLVRRMRDAQRWHLREGSTDTQTEARKLESQVDAEVTLVLWGASPARALSVRKGGDQC